MKKERKLQRKFRTFFIILIFIFLPTAMVFQNCSPAPLSSGIKSSESTQNTPGETPAATNQSPIANAGADSSITLPATSSLGGSVSDDGLPSGSVLTAAWSKVSGAGTVTFANASAATTTASFSQAGTYVLRLTASDGTLSSSDTVTVIVASASTPAPPNQAPTVNAGPNRSITLPATASLNGSASDDGLPAGSTLTRTWSKDSGAGTVTFANASAAVTTASFSQSGTYVLRLTASDGTLSSSDTMSVVVAAAPPPPPPTGLNIKTDHGVYMQGAPPTLPAAGVSFNDPTFGSQMMRVTDTSTSSNSSCGQAYSYWPTFNKNSTKILALCNNQTYIYDFNPDTFQLGNKILAPSGVGSYEWAVKWSSLDPNFMYGTDGTNIRRLNVGVANPSWTTIKSLATSFPAGAYFFQLSVSNDDDIFAFTVKNASYNAIGYAVYKHSTQQVLKYIQTNQLDEVQIDKSGRYLVVKTGLQGRNLVEVKIIDLQANTTVDLIDDVDFSPGHSDNGYGTVIGEDNWRDAITWRELSNPKVSRVLQIGNWAGWRQPGHISMLHDTEDWALISWYGSVLPNKFNNEIYFLKTDGSGKVVRFVHHYTASNEYSHTPRANISKDGRFVAFTSDWGSANGRTDLFIVRAPNPAAYHP